MISSGSAAFSRDGRFARFEAIEWWDQALLATTKVLVIGAGALGNEIIKNLALLGVGRLAVVDMDRVELSNLARSVLFRESDAGQFKAECAVRAARELYPAMEAQALTANILGEVGYGWFRWADYILAGLDNREARIFVNGACARVGRPWLDGGIDVLQGIARGFSAPATACYECTMSQVDWELVNQRRSCSLVARRAADRGGTPTTGTTASVIGAIQVQEMVKLRHGRGGLLGRGFVFEGAEHGSYVTSYAISPQCPWHEAQPPIEAVPALSSAATLRSVWAQAEARLGPLDALDLAREIVARLECVSCGEVTDLFQPAHRLHEDQLRCRGCGAAAAPVFLHSIEPGSPLLERPLSDLGLPPWDIVWARRGSRALGLEMAGDRPAWTGNS